jgi:hypothetical protein
MACNKINESINTSILDESRDNLAASKVKNIGEISNEGNQTLTRYENKS